MKWSIQIHYRAFTCSSSRSDPEPVSWFIYGVASGDPQQDSMVLWTMLNSELSSARLEASSTEVSSLEVLCELSEFADESFESPLNCNRRNQCRHRLFCQSDCIFITGRYQVPLSILSS